MTAKVLVVHTQKSLSYRVDKQSLDHLIDSASLERDLARLKSVSLPKSGCWLNAIPSHSLGLHMKTKEFRVMSQYRLGMKVFRSSGPCSACSSFSDCYGDHAIACASEGERISRHNLLRDCIFQLASQAALSPVREERAMIPGSNCRPADVYLRAWANGKDAALDVTVVSVLQKSLVAKAADEAGSALIFAWDRRM